MTKLEAIKSNSSYGTWMVRTGPADMKFFWRKSDALKFIASLAVAA